MKEHRLDTFTFMEVFFFTLTVTFFALFAVDTLRTIGLVFATLVFSLTSIIHSAAQIHKHGYTSLVLFAVSVSVFSVAWRFAF